MARPSAGTQRVLAILNLLASNPGKAMPLKEIIDSLKMNRATCHSLVNELVNAGYLYRTLDKLYLLGPAAAQLGKAASQLATPLNVALPEMRKLANRYEVICAAIFRDGSDVVIREQVVQAAHLDMFANRETRWPLRPPFGSVFLAWSSDQQIDTWFESLSPPATHDERALTKAGMAFARANLFQFVVRRMPELEIESSIEWLIIRDSMPRPLEVGTLIEPHEGYALTSMSSPVFDSRARVSFVISLMGFAGTTTGGALLDIAADLKLTCARITNFSQV